MDQQEKVKVLENIIEDMKNEQQILLNRMKELVEENEDLRFQIELKDNMKDEGYEQAKAMIVQMNEVMQVYHNAIDSANKAKDNYLEEIRKCSEMRAKYNNEVNSLIEQIKTEL